jgi:DNA modification methylase
MELYNDDCFLVLDAIDKKVDLVILDLPYGQTDLKWDTKISLDKLWNYLKKISKPTTCFVFFTTTKFGYELIKSNEKWFRYDLVWSKNSSAGFLNCKKMPMRTHEMIYFFYDKLPTYNVDEYHKRIKPIKMSDKYSNVYNKTAIVSTSGVAYEPLLPRSILDFPINKNMRERKHPTEKPIELLKWIIKYYSNENDVVLDPTMGSGSTGVACKELNRHFIGIEIDAKYYEIAKDRLSS